MALRKIVRLEGKSVVQTEIGNIENGTQNVSFSAYVKVTSIRGNKTEVVANVTFKSEDQLFSKQYEVPVSVATGSSNFIAQTYAYLKTLPEFADAVDC
jgi:predicted nucleic acid binding AN1-type Zn finger protein